MATTTKKHDSDTPGRKQNKSQNSKRQDVLKLYRAEEAPFRLNAQEFKFMLVRPDFKAGERVINVDGYVQEVDWDDQSDSSSSTSAATSTASDAASSSASPNSGSSTGGSSASSSTGGGTTSQSGGGTAQANINGFPMLRGNITFVKDRPDAEGDKLVLKDGYRIRTFCDFGKGFKPLWEMSLRNGTVDVGGSTWTWEMSDEMERLAMQRKSHFSYKRGKHKHKKGWFYHEIIRDICRRWKIPVGFVSKGTHRITSFVHKDITPLEAIKLAVDEEHKWTGRTYVVQWGPTPKGGFGLNIKPLKRNKHLYVLKNQILGAQINRVMRSDVATVIVATGTRKRKGKREKLTTTVTDKGARRRLGYIKAEFHVKQEVDSKNDLRRRAKWELKRRLRPQRTVEGLEHVGIADVRRGDAIRVVIPEEGFSGPASLCFVTGVSHTLSSGEYRMACDFGITDPLDPATLKQQRESSERFKKRQEKGKKKK